MVAEPISRRSVCLFQEQADAQVCEALQPCVSRAVIYITA